MKSDTEVDHKHTFKVFFFFTNVATVQNLEDMSDRCNIVTFSAWEVMHRNGSLNSMITNL